MELQFGSCPQCKLEIAEDRLRQDVVVCQHCGFSDLKSNRNLDKKLYRSFLRTSLMITILLVGGFIQAVNWDQYALSVIPLKVKEMSGTATLDDLTQISKICLERKKWDCLEESLSKRYQMNPASELETLAELGKLQFKRGKTAQAQETLAKYFAQGGLNLDASYDYARSLSLLGKIDQASQIYQQILQAKPETLQITVAQNYVRLLMTNNRFNEAKDVLEDIRESGSNASLFMDKEFKEIQTHTK